MSISEMETRRSGLVTGSPVVKPTQSRSRLRFNQAMRLVRRSHLYAGLFMTPWVFLYGITALLFNHPQAFPDQESRSITPADFVGTPLERFLDPKLIAGQVVDAINARSAEDGETSQQYKLIRPEEAVFPREYFTTIPGESKDHSVRIDLASGNGTVRSSPRRQPVLREPPPPFATAPVRLESAPIATVTKSISMVLTKMGMPPSTTPQRQGEGGGLRGEGRPNGGEAPERGEGMRRGRGEFSPRDGGEESPREAAEKGARQRRGTRPERSEVSGGDRTAKESPRQRAEEGKQGQGRPRGGRSEDPAGEVAGRSEDPTAESNLMMAGLGGPGGGRGTVGPVGEGPIGGRGGRGGVAPELSFLMEGGGKVWKVGYNLLTGAITGRPEESQVSLNGEPLSTRRFLLRLHMAHGYPSDFGARWIWAVAVDVMFVCMVGWGITGLLMWWQMKNVRTIGAILLVLSVVVSLASAIGMHSAMLNP